MIFLIILLYLKGINTDEIPTALSALLFYVENTL